MRIGPRSSLAAVAVTVGDALRRHGIRAVLTGGPCASLYTRGAYQSRDMDFIVAGAVTQPGLDRAMASVGFQRRGDRYVHVQVLFYVEVPRGPLAIGDDYQIVPVTRSTAAGRALVLSATDSCRDRLAAFYHWNDRQSLDVAGVHCAAQPGRPRAGPAMEREGGIHRPLRRDSRSSHDGSTPGEMTLSGMARSTRTTTSPSSVTS